MTDGEQPYGRAQTPRRVSLRDRLAGLMRGRTRHAVEAAWLAIGDDFTGAYGLFSSHRALLLNLVDVEEFVRRYGPEAVGFGRFAGLAGLSTRQRAM